MKHMDTLLSCIMYQTSCIGLDQDAANSFYLDYGVEHTYLFIEAQYTRAMIEDLSGQSINVGGTSYLAGLLFEF